MSSSVSHCLPSRTSSDEIVQFVMIITTLSYCLALIAWTTYTLLSIRKVVATKVPGPWYVNLTSLVLKYHELSGQRRLWIHELHQRYGPVVRLSPSEVSFNNLEGIKEIYQSGGSGYEKTEFYDLFTQFGHRWVSQTRFEWEGSMKLIDRTAPCSPFLKGKRHVVHRVP